MDHVVMNNGLPVQQGLYDPRNEKDACGIGFIVNINGEPSHEIITKGHSDPHQSDASRRVRLRSGNRRWRGHPDSDSGQVLPPRMRKARLHVAAGRRVRRRHGVSAGRAHAATRLRRHSRAHCRRRRADGPRLARHSGRWRRDRPRGPREPALHRAGFHPLCAPGWIRRRSSASSTSS